MREYIVVDRVEDGLAVCETPGRRMQKIALAQLPEHVREGDCLYLCGGVYHIDVEETRRRREANAQRLQRLLRRRQNDE